MKHLRNFVLFSLALFLSFNSFSQKKDKETQLTRYDVDALGNGYFREKDLKKKVKDRSNYYADQWFTGTVKLLNGEKIEGYPLKYDLSNYEIDVKVEDNVKVAGEDIVKSFKWKEYDLGESMFVNSRFLEFADEKVNGYLKVLSDGKMKAYQHYYLKTLKGNYNNVLHAGENVDKVVMRSSYYIEKDGKVYELARSRRKNLKYFGEKRKEVKTYIKQNRLSFKDSEDIAKIVSYYNSLI